MTTIERFRVLLGEATERPWTRGNGYPRSEYGIWGSPFFGLIARTEPDKNANAEADAALIVQAVNAAEAFLEVAEALEIFADPYSWHHNYDGSGVIFQPEGDFYEKDWQARIDRAKSALVNLNEKLGA